MTRNRVCALPLHVYYLADRPCSHPDASHALAGCAVSSRVDRMTHIFIWWYTPGLGGHTASTIEKELGRQYRLDYEGR
jgi:hypothetical protein